MVVVDNRTFAANAAQVITRVWNQVLEPDNLRSWQREIEVHFSERTKSSDHSEFKLWLLGQNLVDNWLLTLNSVKEKLYYVWLVLSSLVTLRIIMHVLV